MRIHKNNNKGNYKQNKKRLANTLVIILKIGLIDLN